ncbi:hypothetical protein [Chitinophaga sp. Cy-1792]|uniref:hypothetical protein n=1 Tax=Chitinophaga sp. Cy-1792 TaxID=2608339 RepID=UPI00141F12B0|nr:hypothetical protein [Chitinophaga sp. Cy-1792]NIG55053.1 hypothetical protein [Chitinophaga sp. Cy-1792]
MFKNFLLSFFLLMIAVYANAQQEHKIVGLANPKKTSIQLRWSPASYIAWEMGNKYGYVVERFTISTNGVLTPNPKPVLLYPQPIKPATLQEMEKLSEKEERIAIVAEMIYGDGNKKWKSEAGMGAFFEKQNQDDWRMAMALLSCDMSVQVAKAAGLFLEDTAVKAGERYAYRIFLAQQPKNLIIDTAVVSAAPGQQTLLARPPELAIVCSDSAATLGWLTTFSKAMYTAYQVERSTDGKTFKSISDLPVIPTAPDASGFSYYKDVLPDNDTRFYYRVRGITPFGEYGPYSKVADGIGMPEVAERPVMDTMIVINNKKVKLRWLLPGDLAKQLASIVITRADNGSGPFKTIATLPFANGPVYEYVDEKPFNSNYYRIKGITKRGKAIYSFPYFAQLIDSTPPSVPVGLAGKVDSLGHVTLQWEKNTEPDLKGYRVFRANGLKEDFVEMTTEVAVTPTFLDTIALNTLASKVYYKVIAIDKNYNTSPYSPYLMLKRPDTIAPTAPVITKAYRNDSLQAVVLNWINSESEDVVKYTLYRINTKDSARVAVATWDTSFVRTSYNDTTLQLGNTYYYALTVWDDAGNKSTDISGDVWFETGKRSAIKDIKAVADGEKKMISLSWAAPKEQARSYRIYRAKNDGPFILYATQDGKQPQWKDDEVMLGNVYKYKILAVLDHDIKTEMSKITEVKY